MFLEVFAVFDYNSRGIVESPRVEGHVVAVALSEVEELKIKLFY
jgi:hypothetical protein